MEGKEGREGGRRKRHRKYFFCYPLWLFRSHLIVVPRFQWGGPLLIRAWSCNVTVQPLARLFPLPTRALLLWSCRSEHLCSNNAMALPSPLETLTFKGVCMYLANTKVSAVSIAHPWLTPKMCRQIIDTIQYNPSSVAEWWSSFSGNLESTKWNDQEGRSRKRPQSNGCTENGVFYGDHRTNECEHQCNVVLSATLMRRVRVRYKLIIAAFFYRTEQKNGP